MSCRALNSTEYKTVKSLFDNLRNKCLFVLGSQTGFRVSELLSITIGQVRNKDRLKIERKNMKGKIISREVALNKEAKEAVQDYLNTLKDVNDTSPLFQSRQGNCKSLTRFRAAQILKKAFTEINLQGVKGCHVTRKTFVKNMHNKLGGDIFKTSRAIGHSSIITTVKYLDVFSDEIDNAVNEIGE